MALWRIASDKARLVRPCDVFIGQLVVMADQGTLGDRASIFVRGVCRRTSTVVLHSLHDLVAQWSDFLREEVFCFVLQIYVILRWWLLLDWRCGLDVLLVCHLNILLEALKSDKDDRNVVKRSCLCSGMKNFISYKSTNRVD